MNNTILPSGQRSCMSRESCELEDRVAVLWAKAPSAPVRLVSAKGQCVAIGQQEYSGRVLFQPSGE